MPAVRNPRVEASEALSGRSRVRVLESSPPAVKEGPYFADDPTRVEVEGDGPMVSPVGNADLTWTDVVAGDEELIRFAADRWLGAFKVLTPQPDGFQQGLAAIHQVAQHAVAPVRYNANGKIGLRYTFGGFGTPFYGEDAQVRVEGMEVVAQNGQSIDAVPLTNLGELRDFLAVGQDLPFRGPTRWDLDRPLTIAGQHVDFLGDLYGFATSVLEELRSEWIDEEPTRVQIWPEHFDIAVDLGSQSRRANYGLSPGDEGHPEPYLYVGPWEQRTGAVWNDSHFPGASLMHSDLVAANDQRAAAIDFFSTCRAAL